MPRRLNPPFRNGMVPFQGNLINQQRMPPPYELFPPAQHQQQSFNLPNTRHQQPQHFNPLLVDNNSNVLNVELVNDPRFLNLNPDQQLNFGNVHSIENMPNPDLNNNELEKEQPSSLEKLNDKLKADNNSEIQLINTMNSNDPQFARPNSPLLLDTSQFNDHQLIDLNRNLKFNKDPQLFINRIKQTMVTNESFTMQNPNSKPHLEEKANISNLNETTKILDTSPQQYSPVHFRQTFEQIQAQQQKDNQQQQQQRFNQFTPLLYSNQQQQQQFKNPQQPSTKSSLDVVMPQLMNPLNNQQQQQLANAHLINTQQHQQTSPSPIQTPSLLNPIYNTPNLLKRFQHQQQQQQQIQNALLARLGNHNLNSIEVARRMNNNLIQERATRGNLNQSPSNNSPSIEASNLKESSKDFFTRRTNTHRYVIVTILIAAIVVISIGISVIYIKQKRLNLHNTQSALNSNLSNSYGIRRFFDNQRSSPPASNSPTDSSDSYGPSYLSNRSVTTSVETGQKTTLPNLRTSNVVTHR